MKLKTKIVAAMVIISGLVVSGGMTASRAVQASESQAEQVNKQNISITIDSAAVTIEKSTDSKISISNYNPSVYSVTIEQPTGKDWNVDIHSIVTPNQGNPPLTLYLPEQKYGEINANIKYADVDDKGGLLNGNLIGEYYMAAVYNVLPADFSGTVKINADGGMTDIASGDDYKNCNVIVKNNGQRWTSFVYVPRYFTKSTDGKTFTYANGTKANQIEMTLTGEGEIMVH